MMLIMLLRRSRSRHGVTLRRPIAALETPPFGPRPHGEVAVGDAAGATATGEVVTTRESASAIVAAAAAAAAAAVAVAEASMACGGAASAPSGDAASIAAQHPPHALGARVQAAPAWGVRGVGPCPSAEASSGPASSQGFRGGVQPLGLLQTRVWPGCPEVRARGGRGGRVRERRRASEDGGVPQFAATGIAELGLGRAPVPPAR